MNRRARFLICLYPAKWRERYGEEIEALLEDSGFTWRTGINLSGGAIKMQVRMPSFPKLAIALSMAGVLAGFGVSFVLTPRYASTASMQLTSSESGPAPNAMGHLLQMRNEILSRTSLSAIMQDPRLDLYSRERKHIPLEDVIDRMRGDIRITTLPSSPEHYAAFTISFAYSDRHKAQGTVQALIRKFADDNLNSQRVRLRAPRQIRPDAISRLEERLGAIEKRLGIPASAEAPAQESLRSVGQTLMSSIRLHYQSTRSIPIAPTSWKQGWAQAS
jgi:hypothetical protein